MTFGTTEYILIAYSSGIAGGLLLGWLMWGDKK